MVDSQIISQESIIVSPEVYLDEEDILQKSLVKIQFLERRGRFKSLINELEKVGFKCKLLPNKHYEKYSIIPNINFIKYIKSKANADVFITSNPYYGLFGANIAKKMGKIKYSVFRIVGDYWAENDFRNGNINYRTRCLLKSLENSLAIRNVDFTLAVSMWLRKRAENNGLRNVYTLYNGVDTNRFRPRIADEKFKTQILCIMNFNIYKKIKILYDFLTEYKNSDLTYHICVLGSGTYLDSFKKHVLKLGLDKQVIFKGRVENIEYYYSNCDIVIHPSSLDALPTALLEAGASAKTVVATKVGGIPEIIFNGKTGYLTNNLKQFIFYIEKLMEDPDLRFRMGLTARNRMLNEFTWKHTALKLNKILEIEDIKTKSQNILNK